MNATSLLLEPLGADECERADRTRLVAGRRRSTRSCASGSRPPRRATRSSSRRCSRWCASTAGRRDRRPADDPRAAPGAHRLARRRRARRDGARLGRGRGLPPRRRRGARARRPCATTSSRISTTLVRKELIRSTPSTFPDDDGFRFRHLLIRDAAYESLPKATRAELHERFADWLGDGTTSSSATRSSATTSSRRPATGPSSTPPTPSASRSPRARGRAPRRGRPRALDRGDFHATQNLVDAHSRSSTALRAPHHDSRPRRRPRRDTADVDGRAGYRRLRRGRRARPALGTGLGVTAGPAGSLVVELARSRRGAAGARACRRPGGCRSRRARTRVGRRGAWHERRPQCDAPGREHLRAGSIDALPDVVFGSLPRRHVGASRLRGVPRDPRTSSTSTPRGQGRPSPRRFVPPRRAGRCGTVIASPAALRAAAHGRAALLGRWEWSDMPSGRPTSGSSLGCSRRPRRDRGGDAWRSERTVDASLSREHPRDWAVRLCSLGDPERALAVVEEAPRAR